MVRKLFVCLALIGMATCWPACSRENPILNAIHQDWSFIQKAGGIKIGELKALPGGEHFMPIVVDVSGKTTVTIEPVLLNSPLAIKSIQVEVKDNNILLWIQTCFGCIMYPSTTSDGITLRKLKPGIYKVKYLNNDGSTEDIRVVKAEANI